MISIRPDVSVLMSCFNAARYLPEAIESILSQTVANFEFVIVDDGSTDRTVDIINRYAAADARIVFLEKANTGLADSLNAGMRIARAEWIARLDADDVALPIRLETQIAYVKSHPETLLVGSGFTEIDSAGGWLRDYSYPAQQGRAVRRVKRINSFPPHSSCFYHKATVERLGGFNPRFLRSQDADLWFRLSREGEIGVIASPLVKIRKHDANISSDANGRTQTLYGFASQVCHCLRIRGAADPSSETDREWQEFIAWLSLQIDRYQLTEQRQEWIRLRQRYFSAGSPLIGGWCLLAAFSRSRYAWRIFHKKWFGSRLPRQLADEWVQRQCVVSSG